MTRAWLLLSITAWMLAACGFHLRGALELPTELQQIRITGLSPHSELAQEISAVLQAAGVQLVDTEGAARLQVGGENYDRRLLSVGRSGHASEYELDYRFAYELYVPLLQENAEGGETGVEEMRIPLRSIRLQRDYAHDSENVLGSSSEEEMLLREMRSMAVHQLLRQLQRAGQKRD